MVEFIAGMFRDNPCEGFRSFKGPLIGAYRLDNIIYWNVREAGRKGFVAK